MSLVKRSARSWKLTSTSPRTLTLALALTLGCTAFTIDPASADLPKTDPTLAQHPSAPGVLAPGDFVCFGPGFMFTTRAPAGWTLDNESGQPDGLCLVGYPAGGSWKSSETVIYTNATPKSSEKGTRSLAEMVESDLNLHKAGQPGLRIQDGQKLSNQGRKLVSKQFMGITGSKSFEAVAYVDEPGAVVFLVMTSRTVTGFKRALTAFKSFVEGYHLLASNLVQKPQKNRLNSQ